MAIIITALGIKVKKIFCFLLLTFSLFSSLGQSSCLYNNDPSDPRSFSSLKQTKVSGLNIAGNMFKGLLQYTPTGYNPSDMTKKYPVIIYFHGKEAIGQGTGSDLCQIIFDSYQPNEAGLSFQPNNFGLPGLIEQGIPPPTVSNSGQNYNFIVISPQYRIYDYPGNYPSASEVEAVIDYVLLNYRVDPTRIYLTGMSSGANMVLEYASSSIARARRVAGISLASVCSDLNSATNTAAGNSAANIAAASLPVWFLHCATDAPCDTSVPKKWNRAILASPGNYPPRYTELTDFFGSNPDPAMKCSGFAHNTWTRLYNPNYRVNGTNMYEYFIQFRSTGALPVRLKEFSATLRNGKVYLKWVTSVEKDNAFFAIEKAGPDQKFEELTRVASGGNGSGDKVYGFIDDKPLANLNYYRLSQVDVDGKRGYFETRKILNRSIRNKVTISPNPFISDLSVFITLDKSQKISISVTDLSGKKLKTVNGIYTEGSTEINIKSADLPKGIYLLKISGDNFSEIQKVIRQ